MKVFAESESKLTYEAPNLVELGSVTVLSPVIKFRKSSVSEFRF